MHVEWMDVLLRLLLASGLGALVGLERQIYNKLAGIRTNALVATGSALFVLSVVEWSPDRMAAVRVIAQIASGIGFLGAGVIFKEGLSVSGINTAATIWCTGAVGALCGAGLSTEASIGAGVVLLTHLIGRPSSRFVLNRIGSRFEYVEIQYEINIRCQSDFESEVQTRLITAIDAHKSWVISSFRMDDSPKEDLTLIKVDFRSPEVAHQAVKALAEEFQEMKGVEHVRWEVTTMLH